MTPLATSYMEFFFILKIKRQIICEFDNSIYFALLSSISCRNECFKKSTTLFITYFTYLKRDMSCMLKCVCFFVSSHLHYLYFHSFHPPPPFIVCFCLSFSNSLFLLFFSFFFFFFFFLFSVNSSEQVFNHSRMHFHAVR